MRRERTLPILAERGIVSAGTAIEIVPESRPDNSDRTDRRTYRATITRVEGLRDSIRWDLDNHLYSLSALTFKLQELHGVATSPHYIFRHWRRVGQVGSMWEEAEEIGR